MQHRFLQYYLYHLDLANPTSWSLTVVLEVLALGILVLAVVPGSLADETLEDA
jgi:hypothetical protein